MTDPLHNGYDLCYNIGWRIRRKENAPEKKKCIRFLPLLLACLLLCGCFLEPAEGLYAVPKQSEEYYDLQNAIELALPDGAVYAPAGLRR